MDNLTPVGRIVVWTILALGSALLLMYLPSAVGLVADDAKGGRLVGGTLLFPVFVVSLVSGALFARGRRRLAFWVVGLMLAGLVFTELQALWPALSGRR